MAQQFVAPLRNCKFSCQSQHTHTHTDTHAVTYSRHERNLNVVLLPPLLSTSGDWRAQRILHKKRTKAIENRILATRTMAMAVGSDIASCCCSYCCRRLCCSCIPHKADNTQAQTQCHAPRSMQHFLCCCSSTNDFALCAPQITVYAHITRACGMPHEANHQSSIRQFSLLDSLCLIRIN